MSMFRFGTFHTKCRAQIDIDENGHVVKIVDEDSNFYS